MDALRAVCGQGGVAVAGFPSVAEAGCQGKPSAPQAQGTQAFAAPAPDGKAQRALGHSPTATELKRLNSLLLRRLEPGSEEYQREVGRATKYLESQGFLAADLKAGNADVDQIGKIHVHFELGYEGAPVLWAQVITHLPPGEGIEGASANGQATPIPRGLLDGFETTADDAQALAIAARNAGLPANAIVISTDTKIEKAVYKDKKGSFVGGYRLQLTSAVWSPPLQRSFVTSFIVDGKSKVVADQWNGRWDTKRSKNHTLM